MKIDFRIIPHSKHRYPTVGDYWTKGKDLVHFRVSKMQDKRYPILVFLHEIIEFFICRLRKVSIKEIDLFDVAYEMARENNRKPDCGCDIQEEPGDDCHAPYFAAHQVATQCEKLIANCLGVDWNSYNDTVEGL